MTGEKRIRHGKFCLKCDNKLEKTTDTFGTGKYSGLTVYKCPECGETYQIRRMYEVTQRDV